MRNEEPTEAELVRIVHELHREGLLSAEALAAARGLLLPASSWFCWARQMLLHVGVALVLTGIVFFFAYNWAAMGRFLKLGLLEASLAGCVAASCLQGPTRIGGKLLLLGSTVLTGVLLAVYGQIYQTGADAFELFAAWAFLTFGWVAVSNFAALWLFWIVLLNTGTVLYWHQVAEPMHSMGFAHLCLVLAAIDGAALWLREAGTERGLEWLDGRWLRIILLAAMLAALTLSVLDGIVNKATAATLASVPAWMAAMAIGHACYRFKLPDIAALSLVVASACVVLLTVVGKFLFSNMFHNETETLPLFALVILSVASGAAFWLRKMAAEMTAASREDSK